MATDDRHAFRGVSGRSAVGRRRTSELPLERPAERELVAEADAHRDPRQRLLAVQQDLGGTPEPKVHQPAVRAATVPAAAQAPQVLVAPERRDAVALGAAPIGSSTRDPMFVRWADRGSFTNWSPGPSTTAGGQRLAYGSRIIIGHKMRREIVVFTDAAIYSMQAVDGGTSAFRFELIEQRAGIIGPQAAVANRSGTLFWMDLSGWYRYDGRVTAIDCPVRDKVFNDINLGRLNQVVAGDNPSFHEVWWFYPGRFSTANDRYVVYNYKLDIWYFGTQVKRSAWLSTPLFPYPLGASDAGVFFHEEGYDNTDTGVPLPILSYIRSSPMDIAGGEDVVVAQTLVPDINFDGTPPGANPIVTFSLIASDYPGDPHFALQRADASTILGDGVEIRPYTPKLDFRRRGRKFSIELRNQQTGVFWKSGLHRIWVRKDGKR